MRARLFILAILLTMSAFEARAQRFVWDLDLVTRFDNREYKSPLSPSQTIFGARITPQVGLGWGNGNYIKVGANMMADFAANTFSLNEFGLVYYGYERHNIKVFAGRFDRTKLRGSYSNAFFSDSLRYYDNDLEGVLFQLDDSRHWFVEAGCDWNGAQSETSREKFMLFTSASYRLWMFQFGANISMYHHAASKRVAGVVDNLLANPFVEFDLARILPFDRFSIRVGYLQALQNDREYVGKWVAPGGNFHELRIEKWGLGIYDAYYEGGDLMPYYGQYGPGLYQGEAFFRTGEKLYNRLEVYWRPFHKHRDLDLRIASTHHFDGIKWNWQQVVQFSVRLNDRMFRRKVDN